MKTKITFELRSLSTIGFCDKEKEKEVKNDR